MRLALHALIAVLVTIFCSAPIHAQTGDPTAGRVDQLMTAMTLEQKVGQLFLVSFRGPSLSRALRRMIVEQHVGGVVLFNRSGNIVTARQTVKLVNDLQAAATGNVARVPLFVAIDEEGGMVTRLPREATWFPSQMALGATGSPDYARAMARAIAAEMKSLGVNMNLGPVLDVNDNSRNPIIVTRAFGAAPELVATLGAAMIEEYERSGVIAVAKHFPGHGGASLDSHTGLPFVHRTLNYVRQIDLLPFTRVITAGADAIMTAHVVFPALDDHVPATLSPRVLGEVLRREMRFDGMIVSDALSMRALTTGRNLNTIALLAFKAGVDVLAISSDAGKTRADPRTVYAALLDAVKADESLRLRLDESVRRILTVKARYGILDTQPLTYNPGALSKPEFRSVARQIALGSVTLVRDRDRLVPMAPDAKALLVLPIGAGDLARPVRACRNQLAVSRVRPNPTAGEIKAVTRRAKQVDTVIIGTWNADAHPGQAALVNALLAQRVIVVALQSPYDLTAFPDVPTYLTAYSDVPYSLEAVADVLCGKSAPVGVSPVPITPSP